MLRITGANNSIAKNVVFYVKIKAGMDLKPQQSGFAIPAFFIWQNAI